MGPIFKVCYLDVPRLEPLSKTIQSLLPILAVTAPTISEASFCIYLVKIFAHHVSPKYLQLSKRMPICMRTLKVGFYVEINFKTSSDVKSIVHVNACRGREHEELADIEVDSLAALSISVKGKQQSKI